MSNIVTIQQQFGEYLFNFIKSRVPSQEDAQDIYQEMLLKIMSKSNQLTQAQSLKSWLFTIAKNQITDYYRAKKKTADVDELGVRSVADQEEASAYQELEGCLSGFINALPEDYRNLIVLSEIEGKSQKELAESLGINYVTLRSKVQRGRDRIKKMIFDACVVEKDIRGGFVDCVPKDGSPSCSTSGDCGCG